MMLCSHESGRRVVARLEVLSGREWVKAADHTFCADCSARLSIATYPGAFSIHGSAKTRDRIIRDDRQKGGAA